MRRFDTELSVGIFLLIGLLALGYLSIKLGKMEMLGSGGYSVYAKFDQAGGVKSGAVVEIAGVQVGKVKSVLLDKDYQALMEFIIQDGVKIQDDAIASVRTKGLIGEKYILITPGGSEKFVNKGEKIRETESPVDIEELIGKYVFGKV
ncbi:MAG: outer membrane lipid asymmetry maintenance protein MlaD [Dissulfurispiraceae bacterium]|jgi:phospholipid/cholesterol/gamma-HCH transport system substrate-binding protein|nr:outer membrane lipid asymmetry maintenance protein MlaD [Dissulfurispiraceae bacterium]